MRYEQKKYTGIEKSKPEIKIEHLHNAKSTKSKATRMKQKHILKYEVTLMSQTSTELNVKLSIIDTLNQKCGN